MHDLCDHAVCFLGNRPFGGILPDRFYEFCKRSSCMDPASCDFKITAFPCKFMIDLVCRCCDTVAEKILWSWSFSNRQSDGVENIINIYCNIIWLFTWDKDIENIKANPWCPGPKRWEISGAYPICMEYFISLG